MSANEALRRTKPALDTLPRHLATISGHGVKTVIFVGGTAYSGSTMLDMMLANDPRGFSCGEINAVFYPYRPHHLALNELSAAVDWSGLKKGGVARLYENLFKWNPDVDFIVDSSKSPLWIAERSADLTRSGIRVENILIWKDPETFRVSRKKRNRERGWQREWTNYHRYYFSMIDRWRSVRYADLVTNRMTLRHLCQSLGLEYFEGKEQFWKKEHHTTFGNSRAKIHLYDKESKEYAVYKKEIDGTIANQAESSLRANGAHQALYFEGAASTIPNHANPSFSRIVDLLHYSDLKSSQFDAKKQGEMVDQLRIGRWYHAYQMVKQKYSPVRIRDTIAGFFSSNIMDRAGELERDSK